MNKLTKDLALLISFIFILVSLTGCMNPEKLLKETESQQKKIVEETQAATQETKIELEAITEEETQEIETQEIETQRTTETEELIKNQVDLNNYIKEKWEVESTSGGKVIRASLTFVKTLEREVTFRYEIIYDTEDGQNSPSVLVDDCTGSIDGNLVHYNFVDSYGNIGRGQLTLLDGKIQISSSITQRNSRAEYDAAIDVTLTPAVETESDSEESDVDDSIVPDSKTQISTEEN
ncbi:MAG TPA: hypothetical protein IAC41_00510 [Candidatus Merdenecus merdavium]|nr:hypothetical protein [Candidatus Merdenecus merdavium]